MQPVRALTMLSALTLLGLASAQPAPPEPCGTLDLTSHSTQHCFPSDGEWPDLSVPSHCPQYMLPCQQARCLLSRRRLVAQTRSLRGCPVQDIHTLLPSCSLSDAHLTASCKGAQCPQTYVTLSLHSSPCRLAPLCVLRGHPDFRQRAVAARQLEPARRRHQGGQRPGVVLLVHVL